MENILNLYKEMRQEFDNLPKNILEETLSKAKESFPIGSIINVIGTTYVGEVVRYNERQSGFYPGYRYPIYVKIIHATHDPHNAVGMTFEYSLDNVNHTDLCEIAYVDVFLNDPPRFPENEEYMTHYNDWLNL